MTHLIRPKTIRLVAVILTFLSGSAIADDTDIFNPAQSLKPNILLLLDTSASMKNKDGTGITRMDRMKSALDRLLTTAKDVNIGLLQFYKPWVSTDPWVELLHPIVDVEANRESLKDVSSELVRGKGAWNGTPTVAALIEAQRYFSGSAPYRGVTFGGTSNYVSPVSHQCEANYIVVLTDGQPTPDVQAANDTIEVYGGCSMEKDERGACGIELVTNFASVDQLSLPGSNKIVTHSIGFNIKNDWIRNIAKFGKGEYRDAASSDDLLLALRDLVSVSGGPGLLAAPTIPVNAFNENRHGTDMYYSFFQPTANTRWEGNIKKYRLLDGVIVDKNDMPLIFEGAVDINSQSMWSDTPDGSSVAAGGMADRLPVDRKWYTDAGVAPAVDGSRQPRLISSSSEVTPAAMGAASNDERDKLVQWVMGADSIDRNDNSNTTEANKYLADSLHGSPVIASYRVREADDINDQALFTATNMGVLHAIDPATGDELWSYSPEELLPNIKEYVDNTSTTHVYGLDGMSVLHTTTKLASVAYDQEIENAWLYLTQRRGGNNIFALDVTNALAANDPFKVMWKINGGEPGTDFRDLGQTWSTPQLVPVRSGCPDACVERNLLLFSGGYNPVYDDENLAFPVTPDVTGHGNAIYLVDPETGELLWSAGNGSHHSLDLPINDSVPTTPLPVDTDADGVVNILFMADIAGHLWRIDLDQTPDDLEDLAISGGMIADLNEPGGTLRFYNRPDVVIVGNTAKLAKFHVVIGSGMRASPLLVEAENNRLFSIVDQWVFSNPVSENAATGNLEPNYNYVKRPHDTRSVISTGDLGDDSSDSTVYGFFNTLEAGEKVLGETLTHAGRVFLSTYVPPVDPTSPEHCGQSYLGNSRLYLIDLVTGENALIGTKYEEVGPGIVPVGAIIDTGNSGGPDMIVGFNSIPLDTIIEPSDPHIFRRFIRTGWSELDY